MRTYEVVKGDTLSEIAERECGSAGLVHELWSMNHVVLIGEQVKHGVKPFDRDLIYPGTILALPERTGNAPAPEDTRTWAAKRVEEWSQLPPDADVTVKAHELQRVLASLQPTSRVEALRQFTEATRIPAKVGQN